MPHPTVCPATRCPSHGSSRSLGDKLPDGTGSSSPTPSMHPRELYPPANTGNTEWTDFKLLFFHF